MILTTELKPVIEKYNPSLLDVQTVGQDVYYLFRTNDSERKKLIYRYKNTNNYYYYVSKTSKEQLVPINELTIDLGPYDQLKLHDSRGTFEKDFNLGARHAIDFYETYPDNQMGSLRIMFLDIELDMYGCKDRVTSANPICPVCMLSLKINDDKMKTLTLDSAKIDKKKLAENDIEYFTSERDLLNRFVQILHTLNPDVITAWNVSFDCGYIPMRMKRLCMNPNELSLMNYINVVPGGHQVFWAGFVIVDMLTLYKGFTSHGLPSYRLDMVAQFELGEGKQEFEGEITELFIKDPTSMITYNIQDVNLIYRINKKLMHIELQNGMREFCGLTWDKSLSTIGLIDGLLVKFARKANMAIMTNMMNSKKLEQIRGAYVKNPKGGLYEWVIDLDYSSLYPSIIRSFNMGMETIFATVSEKISFDFLYKNKFDPMMTCEDGTIPITFYPGTPKEFKKTITVDEFRLMTKNYYLTLNGVFFEKHSTKKSLYNTILSNLTSLRNDYKKLKSKYGKENNKVLENVNHIRQWATKILSNAMYGALNNEYFRFFNPHIGISITSTAQEAIKMSAMAVDQALENNFENIDFSKVVSKFSDEFYSEDIKTKFVIYCDTDSMFINLQKMVQGSKDPIKDINEKWAPLVSKVVNDILIKNNYLQFHGLESNNCVLDVKQEWIARTMYMLNTKKKYCLWLVEDENKTCDKVKLVGLETQRSDVPEFTRVKLKELMEIILKTGNGKIDLQRVLNFVDNTEKAILKLIYERSVTLGKPVSFSKDADEYKNMPQHIRAMLTWNGIVHEDFHPGQKGYLYKILGIEVEKLKTEQLKKYNQFIKNSELTKIDVIAIPQNLNSIPECFILDVPHLVDISWKSIVTRILEPIVSISNTLETF